MYEIVFELNYYDGPLEGICQKSDGSIYYYCITNRSDIHTDGPRAYYLYALANAPQPLTWTVITEDELTTKKG